ncbi:diguanylate cyclase [Vibrio sp. PP-XX7]
MKYIALTIVASGIGLLIFSLKPAQQITRHHQMAGWQILIRFIYISLLGYLIFFGELLVSDSVSTMMFLMAAVLLAGSLFVVLSVSLSLDTIQATNRFALAEQRSALHDSMTGLANRKYMFQSLESFIQTKQPFSLLFIDLNNFKQINDGLGHYFGDKFLVSVAARLQQCTQTYGDLFRIGGDEFAIIIQTTKEPKILQLIHEIHQALQTPIEVATYTMKTSTSIGITQFSEHGKDVSDLVKEADLAMYNSKRNHKAYTFYNKQLGAKSHEKLQLSNKLSTALQKNEFELHYQPIIQGEHRQLYSLEVLIRWPQQDGQFISPEDFIPIAEKSALISALTKWVIEHSTHDLETLRSYGFEGSLHINLSAKDFQDNEVTDYLRVLIASGKLSPSDFVFEITENAVFEDIPQATRVINEIHNLGFRFSL